MKFFLKDPVIRFLSFISLVGIAFDIYLVNYILER